MFFYFQIKTPRSEFPKINQSRPTKIQMWIFYSQKERNLITTAIRKKEVANLYMKLGEDNEKESLKYSEGFGERETLACPVELKSL